MCRKNTGKDIYEAAHIRKHFRKCFRWKTFYYGFNISYVIVYTSMSISGFIQFVIVLWNFTPESYRRLFKAFTLMLFFQ